MKQRSHLKSSFDAVTIPVQSAELPRLSLITVGLVLVFFLSIPCAASSVPGGDVVYRETIKLLAKIPDLDPVDLDRNKQVIRTLSYNQTRALRAFSQLPDITGQEVISIIAELRDHKLRFETVLLLDYFSSLPLAKVDLSRDLMKLVTDASYAATRALSSLVRLSDVDAPNFLWLITQVKKLEAPGAWAAKALFELPGLPLAAIRAGVDMIAAMSARHQWVAEQFCRLENMAAVTLLRGLRVIPELSSSSAWNMRGLLQEAPDLSSSDALAWLEDFFRFDKEEQERRLADFSPEKKKILLLGYARASAELAREINDLHSVTDDFGREIGIGRLRQYSYDKLEKIFLALHPRARESWAGKIRAAIEQKQKNNVVDLLYRATEQARVETARELTVANIYILLAHGERLYTSSFKNILIPQLRNRLDNSWNSDILSLLSSFDPDNIYSSRFISSLAWQGALTEFLPKGRMQQQHLLDLVAASAFTNEHSLLLFAATFTRLLQPLHRETRSHLIELMLRDIGRDDEIFSLQLQTILQFYLQTQTVLLLDHDRELITAMQNRRGTIDFKPYLKTPFSEWTSDQKLNSLSVFQQDDDGRASFLSNCTALLKNGYHPELAENVLSAPLPDEDVAALNKVFQDSSRTPGASIAELFRFIAKHPIMVHWKKTVHAIEICHTVTLYRSEEQQQELLLFLLNNGYEMFAQRGHSYWRRHQLFSPLEKLLATGRITVDQLQAKNRFLSLGSCGGIHAYLELGKLFRNRVDILATVGIGSSRINNEYNRKLLEVIAADPAIQSWTEVADQMSTIFQTAEDRDYLQPGSLTAMLQKTLYRTGRRHGTDKKI